MFVVPTSACPLLRDPPFVVWLCLLATAIGLRLTRVLRLPAESMTRLERGVVCIGAGLGLLSNVAFLLGSLHALTPRNVGVSLLGLTLLFGGDIVRVLRSLAQTLRSYQKRSGSLSFVPSVLLLLPVLFFLGTFLQALCPCTDGDGLGYHLRAPKEWLQTGSLDFLPSLTHTNSPMGVEMLYTLALAVWSDTAAKLIHFALGLLTLLAVFALGRRLYNSRVGLAASAFFVLGLPKAPVLALYSYAYIDLGVALEMMCATLAWFAWQRTQRRGWLILSALCAGFGFAFKLTGALFVLTFALLTWREAALAQRMRRPGEGSEGDISPTLSPSIPQNASEDLQRGESLRDAWRLPLLYLCIGFAPACGWLLRSWRLTGNPIYPLFPNIFPTRDWSVAHGHAFDTYMRLYNWGSGHTHWSSTFRLCLLAGVIVGFALGAGWLWRRSADETNRRLLLLAALPSLISFATTGLYLRFLIPLLALYALLLFGQTYAVWNRRMWLQGAFGVWIVLNGLLYLRASTPRVGEALRVALGRETREQYLLRQLPPMPLWNYANATLRPTDRILVSGFGDTYYCNSYCFIVKAFYQTHTRLDTWEHFLADVERDHIGYSIVAPDAAPVPEYGPHYLPADNASIFPQRLARLYGQPLTAASDLVLYRLILPSTK